MGESYYLFHHDFAAILVVKKRYTSKLSWFIFKNIVKYYILLLQYKIHLSVPIEKDTRCVRKVCNSVAPIASQSACSLIEQPSPFRAGAIPKIMMHCLHQYFKLFRYCTLLENFLPIEKGEGLVTVLDKQTNKQTNKQTIYKKRNGQTYLIASQRACGCSRERQRPVSSPTTPTLDWEGSESVPSLELPLGPGLCCQRSFHCRKALIFEEGGWKRPCKRR